MKGKEEELAEAPNCAIIDLLFGSVLRFLGRDDRDARPNVPKSVAASLKGCSWNNQAPRSRAE